MKDFDKVQGLSIESLLMKLPANGRRGSLPRCALFTHGPTDEVASRLTALVAPYGVVDAKVHQWCPTGFEDWKEAQLDKTQPFLTPDQQKQIAERWFAVRHPQAKSPTWDIVSQATIGGQQGLILVEAKAHENELKNEVCGKRLKKDASPNSRKNHRQICECISSANDDLMLHTGADWALSGDHHYQMSNRFAWAWRVTGFGIPVILVYLGFTDAQEMVDRGSPIVNINDWTRQVKSHSNCAEHVDGSLGVRDKPLFPETVWNQTWTLSGGTLLPIIRALNVPLHLER